MTTHPPRCGGGGGEKRDTESKNKQAHEAAPVEPLNRFGTALGSCQRRCGLAELSTWSWSRLLRGVGRANCVELVAPYILIPIDSYRFSGSCPL